jgi:soluble P-type ATPase
MIALDVPGFGGLRLEHLAVDFNGTLAVDGALLPGVTERLEALSAALAIHVVTAHTRGTAARSLAGLRCTLDVLPASGQAEAKRRLVEALGPGRVVAIGNGRNDRLMLEAARLGIAVVQAEGAAAAALVAGDLVAPTIADALDLLVYPLRLLASLRD